MMRRLEWCAVFFLLPCAAFAQIDLRCRLIHSEVVLFESIPVDVTIVNNTGGPLTLGGPDAGATLMFDVERSPGAFMQPIGVPVWTGAVTVAPMSTLRRTVDVLPAYPIVNTGPYTLTARLEWQDRVFVSSRMFLDVVPGLEIGRLVASVPGMGRATRTYTLRTISRDRTERLFLRMDDDDEGRCYGVFNLGRIVRLQKPVMQADEEGQVHVLHQTGPNQFVRHVFTPYGLLLAQEHYTGDSARMRLDPKTDGGVVVQDLNGKSAAPDPGAGGEAIEFEDLFR